MMTKNKITIWIPLIIVLITGAVLGFFVWNTYFGYVPHRYSLDFKQGKWISAPKVVYQGYFRKELYISGTIKQAWIKLAATDSFVLYLNGKTIDAKNDIFNISGVYDISHFLYPGKNLIGMKVERIAHIEPAKAVIEGMYIDQSGRGHSFASDASWKASSLEESQNDGNISWYSKDFYADQWAPAQVSEVPTVSEVFKTDTPADIFTSLPQGKWIGHADQKLSSVIFYNTFNVTEKVQGAWIRIGAYSGYDITINGIAIGSRDASSRTLDIYDIGPFIKKGVNTIQAQLTGRPPYSSPQLILDGMIAATGKIQTVLLTDSTWKTKESASKQDGVGLQIQSNWKPAIILSDYSPFADNLVKNPVQASFPIIDRGKQIIKMLAFILLILVIILLFWLGSSLLIYYLHRDISKEDALSINAVIQLPCLLFLGFIYLLQYDISYDSSFPFQEKFIYIALILLLIPTIAAFLEIRRRQSDKGYKNISVPQVTGFISRHRSLFLAICIAVIAGGGIILRLYNLEAYSLYHDEVTMVLVAKNTLGSGYPARIIGPIEKPMTTYELLPYPIALSIKIFGLNDFAVRFPAFILGVLTMLLICYIGVQMWGIWTGILAAAIYAFSPYAILWGTNVFHPQQAQFLSLITSYLFYKAIDIKTNTIKPKYLYGAGGCFLLTYLTWEGSGFLLPAFFSYLLITRGKDLSWLKHKHFWFAVAIVVSVVALQLSRRVLLNFPYIVVGTGLSTESFTLFFLNPMYDPWFYIQNFLFSGNHIVLTILIILGFPRVFKDQGVRYNLILLGVLLMLLTNLLPVASIRYAYFSLPFLILPASAITVYFASFIWNLQKTSLFRSVNMAKGVFTICLPLVIFLSTNTVVLQLYRLGASPVWIAQMLPEVFGIDYRSTDHFVNKHIGKDDIVIALMPHTMEYYSGRRSNYYLQTYTDRQIFYDVSGNTPGYLDKFIGSSVIRSITELKDVLNRNRRVWIVAAPYVAFLYDNDKSTIEYINRNAKVVHESYKTRIYLWEK